MVRYKAVYVLPRAETLTEAKHKRLLVRRAACSDAGAMVWQVQALCAFVFPRGSARGATVAHCRLGRMFRSRCSVKGLVTVNTMTMHACHR
jgi:hypothetical protein